MFCTYARVHIWNEIFYTRDRGNLGSAFKVMSMKRSTHLPDFHVSQKFWQKCCFSNKMVQDHKRKGTYFQNHDKNVQKL